MFPFDTVTCLSLVISVFMVVDDTAFHDLPCVLLAGKVIPSSFCFRLGSDRKLWRLTLYQEKKIVCVDEVVRKENVAFVRLGRLKTGKTIGIKGCRDSLGFFLGTDYTDNTAFNELEP